MPLTEEQKAAIKLVGTIPATDADEAVEELKANARPVYETTFNAGHDKATKKKGKDERDLERQITAKDAEIARLQGEIEKAKGSTPDVEKVKADYKAEIAALEAKHAKEIEDRDSLADEREVNRVVDRLEILVTDPKAPAIRKAWARNLLRDPDIRKRIKPGKGDHPTEILQAGKEIAIQAKDFDEQLKAFGKELFEKVKAEDSDGVVVPVDDGSGVEGGGGGGEGGDGYDAVAAGKAMAAAQKGATDRSKNVAFT